MARGFFDLAGKVALVTGGNGGIGLGFARGLAKAGSDIVIWGRNADKNMAAVAELSRHGVKARAFQVDVADEAAVKAGIVAAVREMGRLDCVIANAGIASIVPSVLDLSSEQFRAQLATSLDGGFFTLREAARHMVARAQAGDAGGSLIVCGSLSQFIGVPGMEHYAAAKGAIAAVSRGMAVELGQYGIRVNVVAPGYTKTDLGRDIEADATQAIDTHFITGSPLRRLGRPADFEGVAVYLASDAAAFHTGDTLVIDGGWLIR